jgi:hypothetical protein
MVQQQRGFFLFVGRNWNPFKDFHGRITNVHPLFFPVPHPFVHHNTLGFNVIFCSASGFSSD